MNGPPKSRAGRRTLAVPDELMALLAAHLLSRSLTGSDTHARLFVTRDGTDLEYSNFRDRRWVPACAEAALDNLTFHDLRRLAATTLVAEGIDVKTTQTRLGHSSPQITLGLYAQVTGTGDRKAAQRVGQKLMGFARYGRAMESDPVLPESEAQRPDQDTNSGASKNRTCDLSIISAAL